MTFERQGQVMGTSDMRHNSAAAEFSTVEELQEDVRSVGWDVDYRQISKGRYCSEHASLAGAEISLMSVNFKVRLQIAASGAPEGYIGFLLPRIASAEVTMLGTALTDGALVFCPAGSKMHFVVSDGAANETIWVPEDEFLAIARALAPSETSSFPEAATIYQADPSRFAPLRREIFSMLRTGCLDTEAASRLLAMCILWMTDASPELRTEQLGNGRAAAIARKAQAFIESNYQNKIRLEDLCTYTEVGSRTLQRCFASYFQMGAFEYIKVRRLNAARRALLAADPSYGSVTNIAVSKGLSHLGRFSADYRAYFGESPRETLAARKSIVSVQ